ncbi:MAG: hypothetical protein LBT59_08345 [Clostridiales bacterium]|nr:hypothetical protein [Clostridiales bacterium]
MIVSRIMAFAPSEETAMFIGENSSIDSGFIDQATGLANEAYGDGFFSPDAMSRLLSSGIVFTACEGEALSGFSCVQTVSFLEAAEDMGLPESFYEDDDDRYRVVGYIKALVASPSEHGKIATLLLEWIDKRYSEKGLDELWICDWKRGGLSHKSALKGLGFEKVCESSLSGVLYRKIDKEAMKRESVEEATLSLGFAQAFA